MTSNIGIVAHECKLVYICLHFETSSDHEFIIFSFCLLLYWVQFQVSRSNKDYSIANFCWLVHSVRWSSKWLSVVCCNVFWKITYCIFVLPFCNIYIFVYYYYRNTSSQASYASLNRSLFTIHFYIKLVLGIADSVGFPWHAIYTICFVLFVSFLGLLLPFFD